jgi:hypothetical protein
MLAGMRAVWDAMLGDDLGGTATALVASIVLFVPGGSALLILRWAPVRRALRGQRPGASAPQL